MKGLTNQFQLVAVGVLKGLKGLPGCPPFLAVEGRHQPGPFQDYPAIGLFDGGAVRFPSGVMGTVGEGRDHHSLVPGFADDPNIS